MWYPTKLQWLFIWATTVVCLVCWLASDPPWEAFITPAILVMGLFCWHASADFVKRPKE
jgi:hypothetical protein